MIHYLILWFLPFLVGSTGVDKSTTNQSSENFHFMDTTAYESEWKKIDSLIDKQLFQSARKELDNLKEKWGDRPDPIDLFQYHAYYAKIILKTEEEGDFKSLIYLEDQIRKAVGITQSLLKVVQAFNLNGYVKYYNYQISETEIERADIGNIKQWTIKDFNRLSSSHMLEALEDESLKNYSVNNLSRILTEGSFADEIVSTLYDVVLGKAISLFSEPALYLHTPVYEFDLNEAGYLSPMNEFANLKIEDTSGSNYSNALRLYQLSIEHFKDDLQARIYFDLNRLRFIGAESQRSDKDSLLIKTLNYYYSQFNAEPVVTEIAAMLARTLQNQGARYDQNDPVTEKYRWKLQEAVNLATEAAGKFPESFGAKHCLTIVDQIKHPSGHIQLETNQLPNAHLLASVEFKNMDSLSFEIFQLTREEYLTFQNIRFNERQTFLEKLNVFRRKTISFSTPDDFQTHRIEIAIDPLPVGLYIIRLADSVNNQQDHRNIAVVNVCELEMIRMEAQDNRQIIFVIDRERGFPVKGATIEVQRADRSRNAKPVVLESGKTDDDGKFVFTPISQLNIQVVATHKDSYISSGFIYTYSTGREWIDQPRESVIFFTDRKIYRPGQIIYYKGLSIVTKGLENKAEVRKNHTIDLLDVNRQIIASQTVTTNDFGTFFGTFIIPANVLTGNFFIRTGRDHFGYSIRVEEYKRPSFEVKIEVPDKALRLNAPVTVSGFAKMYAGTPVRNAGVTYVVRRTTRFFNWGWRFRGFPFDPRVKDIAVGETNTDENGRFDVTFEVSSETDLPRGIFPTYQYEVIANVTDVTGETRAGNLTLQLQTAEYVLELDKSIVQPAWADKFNSIGFSVKSVVSDKPDIEVNLQVIPLKAPDELLVNRRWNAPNLFNYDDSSFKKLFPHAPYKNEHLPENWKRLPAVVTTKVNPSKTSGYSFESGGWLSGKYEIILSLNDSEGNLIEDRLIIDFFNPGLKVNNGFNSPVKLMVPADPFEPGQTVKAYLLPHKKNTCTYIAIEKNIGIVRQGWKKLSEVYQFDMAVEENDRGNFFIQYFTGSNGYVHAELHSVIVPWTNRNLSVKKLSVRDKIYPGSKESWNLQIGFEDNIYRRTEVLATMYDASLDIFSANRWSVLKPRNNSLKYRFQPVGNALLYLNLTDRMIPSTDANRVLPNLNGRYFLYYYHHDVFQRVQVSEYAVPMMEQDNTKQGRQLEAVADSPPGDISSDEVIQTDVPPLSVRTNLNETVFFYPHINPDNEGKFSLDFTMNEALTRWKAMLLVHDKDGSMGYEEFTVETQKDVMVFPNVPRFLRQSDTIRLVMKIENLSDKDLVVKPGLQIRNALNNTLYSDWIIESPVSNSLTLKANSSTDISWLTAIPSDFSGALKLIYSADAGQHKDAEEHQLTVLSNKIWVTESYNLWANPEMSKSFTFEGIRNRFGKDTRSGDRFTLEFTSNPTWFAVMALPVLLEDNRNYADAIVGRYFANQLSMHIVQSIPNMAAIFNSWQNSDALISELEKNQSLKSIVLEATPWVRQAQNESEQRKRIALLFELNSMTNRLQEDLQKLIELQNEDGGFPWFSGAASNLYTTQNILEHLAQLDRMGVKNIRRDPLITSMLTRSIGYADREIVTMYNRLKDSQKDKRLDPRTDYLSPLVLHYLYVRSFFPEIVISGELSEVISFYLSQCEKLYLNKPHFQQALMAIVLHRNLRSDPARTIIKMLRENALTNEELGTYWRYNSSYFWYTVPVDAHTTLMEAFMEVEGHSDLVENMKKWLLKQKQTRAWRTGKSTAKAIYSLLFNGPNWLEDKEDIVITVSGTNLEIDPTDKQTGTGYFTKMLDKKDFSPESPIISIQNPNKNPVWGGLYWQYFQELDKVEYFGETPLKVRKTLYKKIHDASGMRLVPITDNAPIKIGDVVTVRLELEVDRAMEFVHLNDKRASGFELVEVLSGYRYQKGMGYYQSMRDTGVDMFFDFIAPGAYVMEYDFKVFHSGTILDGNASIQSAYAPEFRSHSSGRRIEVRN